jgi:hypothetical protein
MFYEKINKAEMKPAILKITLPYAEDFIPILSNNEFPIPIVELYNPEMLHVDYLQLLSECEKVFETIVITEAEAALVESKTIKRTVIQEKLVFV